MGLYLQISIVLLSIILGVIICIYIIISKSFNFKYMIICIILICGNTYTNILEKNFEEVYNAIEGEKNIKAIVISEAEDKEYKYRYTIKIESINNDKKYEGIKMLLDIKLNNTKYIPKFGDEISFKGEISIPNTSRNYKGFDYRQFLKTRKIYGTIEGNNIQKIDENCLKLISRFVNLVQKNMKESLNKILNNEEASLCIGILIGDRSNISEEIEDNFKNSNLTHMLAVSGSHIAYIINGFAVLLNKSNKKVAKFVTIVFLIFFIILTGFTASVLRASFMGILVLISGLFYRKPDILNNLGIASLIILLINPYTIFDIGFILSFAGTLGIVLFSDKINKCILEKMKKILFLKKIGDKKIIKYIVSSFSITLSANLLIIPIMAYSFSTFSFTFWISNILAGPVMEIVTIFGFIVYFISIIFPSLANLLGILLNFLLSILIKIAEISSLIPGSTLFIKTPYLFHCLFYYICIYIIYNKQKCIKFYYSKLKKLKFLKIFFKKNVIILTIFIFVITNIIYINNFSSNLTIFFIDVGQGDSTLIQTPYRKNILIDGGGSEFGNYDVGENILLPYLLDRRITKLDYIIISHFDSDHVKGLFSVIRKLNIANIIISKQGENSNNFKEFQEIVKDKNINIIVVKKGDLVQIDKASYIEIIFPEEKLIENNVLNNNSIVFKFISNNFSMLFTGDIEEIAEKRICEIYNNTSQLKSDILKAAHHGSKTSSTDEFLTLVKPKIVLIGVGEDNNFGHPDTEIIKRFEKYTNNILRTDESGEIIIEYNWKKIRINKHIK